MTVGEWVASRVPTPPAPLIERVLLALGDSKGDEASLASERCLAAAERLVGGLLRDGRTGRESAGELLAADALVTYAFEAASDDPARIEERARAAMRRLAQLGAIGGGSPVPR